MVKFILNLIPFEFFAIILGTAGIFSFLFVLAPRDDGLIDPKILGKVKIIEIRGDCTIVENSLGVRVKVREVVDTSHLGEQRELGFVNHIYQFK